MKMIKKNYITPLHSHSFREHLLPHAMLVISFGMVKFSVSPFMEIKFAVK